MNAVELAIKMETDAISFYREAAEKTSHPFGKKMFLSFVEDEKRHLEMLSSLFKEQDFSLRTAEPLENMKTIFESLKDQMMDKISASTDELKAIKIAMDMEQEGFEHYKKTAAESKNDKERALFERLAYEEERHYQILENTNTYISDSGNWYMWNEYSIVEG